MFDYCALEERICSFCAKREAGVFCGIAKGVNKIEWMDKCPLPEMKKNSKNKMKKNGL